MGKPRRGPGQPPRAGIASTDVVRLRVTSAERKAWEHAAVKAGVTLSEWIRQRCTPSGET